MKKVVPYQVRKLVPRPHAGSASAASKNAGRSAAFSLIEVIAATAVMALSIGVGIIALQIGMRNLELARTSTAAAQVLQNEAERLRLMNWSALAALPQTEALSVPEAFTSNALPAGRVAFSRTVSDVPDFTDMKEILLRATWTAIDGRSHERAFRMRYAKGGIHDYYYGSGS